MRAHLNGTDLFYVTHGSGTPLLVMHGGLGWDHTYFRPALDALGEQVELIYYDHRGNGRSARPERWEQVSHGTWIEDADALRAHLGHEKMVVFGHSYGGYLAQEYALAFPERVAGLILCCTAPIVDYAEAILDNARARATPEQLQGVMEAFSGPVAEDAALRRISSTILPLYFHAPDPARERAVLDAMEFSAAAFDHALSRCLPAFNSLDRLGQVRAPTLVLAGGHDWIAPPAQGAARLHEALPRSELIVFSGSGHFPWLEEEAEFLTAVTDWLRRLH